MATLTLEITNTRDANPRDATQHVFGEDGGSIGRVPSSSWVLSHNKVSGQHAQISFRSGVFYLQDMSRNGVSVNSPDNRLVRNRPYALKAGDRIFIEPYEIDVWIDAGSERATRQTHADPFAEDPFAPQHDALLPDQNLAAIPASPVNEEVDPLKFFDPVASRAPRKPEPVVPHVDELLGQHYKPPAVVSSPAPTPKPTTSDPVVIPAGWNPLSPDEPAPPEPPPPEPPPPPPPAPVIRPRPGDSAIERRRLKDIAVEESPVRQPATPPIPPRPPIVEPPVPAPPVLPPPVESAPRPVDAAPRQAGQTADLAELMSGAGVPDAVITPELSRQLGQIIRIVVAGLMDILQSRQRIKEEFGIQHTMFRPADNNPLKFSANVEDALHNLLVKRNAAYLGPVDAFADAFDDLRDHQLAMLAGLRVAFDTMLTEFDTDRMQEDFDAQMSKHALPLIPAKMRYWDLYRDKYQALLKDPDVTFDRLFGEEFKRAYEEQFRKLKAARRTRTQQGPEPPASKK